MQDKKIFVAMLVLLVVILVLLLFYCVDIVFLNMLFMPLLLCISKLLERLGWTFYHSSFGKDLKGLVVVIVVLVVLLIYNWNPIIYWFLIGTVLTLFGLLICKNLYKSKK